MIQTTTQEPNMQTFEIGQRVRVQLPNWNGPGCIAYTIKSINAERGTITLNAPRNLPGGSIVGPTVFADQIVKA